MRPRRQRLHVSTFPFLAVLLCTMGSLILVLLVMDRRAKRAAVAKAQEAAAQVAQRQAEEAAQRRADYEREQEARLAENERRREELHTRLVREESELEKQRRQMLLELAAAAARLTSENFSGRRLQQQEQDLRGRVIAVQTALAEKRGTLAKVEGLSDAAQQELVRMTADLALLEQTLKALKAARERERQTYSVVPYHGKQGDARRPLYVECTASGLLFPPEKVSVPITTADALAAEVRRRLEHQREHARASGDKADPKPYMLLLVRPDGIMAGNGLQGVLRDMGVEYGYELVDADWVLDFPTDEQPLRQPWMTAQGTPAPPGGPDPRPVPGRPLKHFGSDGGFRGDGEAPPAPAAAGRVATIGPPRAGGAGDGAGRYGGSGPSGTTGSGPFDPLHARPYPASMSASDGVPGVGGGYPGGSREGSLPDYAHPPPPAMMDLQGAIGEGNHGMPGPVQPPHLGGLGLGRPYPAGQPGGNTASSAPSEGSSGGNPGGVPGDSGIPPPAVGAAGITNAGSALASAGRAGGSSHGGNGGQPGDASGSQAEPGTPHSTLPGAGGSGASAASRSGTQGADSSSGDGSSDAVPGLPRPDIPMHTAGGGAPTADGAASDAVPPPAATGAGQPPTQPAGTRAASGGQGGGPDDGLGRFAPPAAPGGAGKRPRTVTLRPARLRGDRDWILFLECRPDSVVLYPPGRSYPMASLGGPENLLLTTLQDMIARRQALVRPGDLPYRPHLRFLVRAQSLRTYYQVFPMLEALPIPKSRQNLQPEDDVEAVLAGS
jgi:hypothetical protein